MQRTDLLASWQRLIPAAAIIAALMAITMLATGITVAADPEEACSGGGYNPTPTAVEVTTVPIAVESTTNDYFVLYAEHEVDGSEVELPVLVKRGEEGTTTLSENVEALPAERYRVEKYLITDPADVDGDCVDDITELDGLGNLNPVNPGVTVELNDGALAISDQDTIETLTRDFGSQSYLKYVVVGIETTHPAVYFMNTVTHPDHASFLTTALGLERNDPSVIRGEIGYAPEIVAPDGSQGLYYHTTAWRSYSFSLMERTHTLIAASMPLLEDNLAYWIASLRLRNHQSVLPMYRASRIPLVFDADVFPNTDFLALNPGLGYGRLQALEPDDEPHPRDVVLYEALPNELPRVAGIISAVPQTPLSHVNLRAAQDGIPNSYIRDVLNDADINALIGSFVRYQVTEDGWSLRAATTEEVDDHYESSRPAQAQTPQRDLSVTSITPLSSVHFEDWTAFGVKAANLAELGGLGFVDGTVPDGFAIPFYFYDEFMKANEFDDRVEQMLADEEFQTDFAVQDDMLDDLRDDIKDANSPQWIIDALTEMHASFPEGTSLRYRSSTNNEDLPGFNGAGLYDSKTQDPDETIEDGIDKSLKGVYASLWTFRAFTEREFHRIDHTAAAMGVLVHPNFSDELANGVAVSFAPISESGGIDPVTDTEGWYYVNAQAGEDLVTNPEAHSVPEEILLGPHGVHRILSVSNQVEIGELLISWSHLSQIRARLEVIHEHFEGLYDPATDEPFAMEIEFKITSDNILAIKQARPWVFSSDASAFLPALRISDAEADEGGNVEFTVLLSEATTDSVTVQYSTSDSTATGSDYTPATGQTLTFAARETEKTITIATTDDTDDEEDESFRITLSNPSTNAVLSYNRTATGTITDDDESPLSTDATLSALDLADAGTTPVPLTPQFAPSTAVYTASVANGVDSVTLAATKNHTGASVAIVETNGTSTPDTATVGLEVGDNLLTATVTAEDGTTALSYVVTVTRDASDDATLSALDLADAGSTPVALTPQFAPSTAVYTASVSNGVDSVTLAATKNHAGASVAIIETNGTSTPDTATVGLEVGDNLLTATVTAEDGTTVLSYVVTVARDASDDATLSGLSLDGGAVTGLTPAFDPATTSYTAEVANTVKEVTVTASANHAGASVSILETDGTSTPDTATIDLDVGDNTITVAVTAVDRTTVLNYQVTVTRSSTWLATLTVGTDTSGIPSPSGYSTWGQDMGAISTEVLKLNRSYYRFLTLMRYSGGLYLNISRALPGDFTLTVGDQEFLASDSSQPATPAAGRYWWDAEGINWNTGDQVEVSIVPTAGSASIPERPPAPPAAQINRVPDNHDGLHTFTFELRFTDDIQISFKTLRDVAFEVTNGAITKAKRKQKGSNRVWTITVRPESANNIDILLPATQDCASQSAICTSDGRMLFNSTGFTVNGPPPP